MLIYADVIQSYSAQTTLTVTLTSDEFSLLVNLLCERTGSQMFSDYAGNEDEADSLIADTLDSLIVELDNP